MEQFDIIAIGFISLIVITIWFAVWAWRSFYKPISKDRIELLDNTPARYEDYESMFYDP